HSPSITTSFGCARTIAGKPSVAAAAPIFRISLRFMGLLPREGASLLQTLRRRSNCSEWTQMRARRENLSMHIAAAMLADPSRAAMVLALMDGRSRNAKKLALDAGVRAQTASAHLRKLVSAKMLVWQGRGRFKYLSLAGSEVAQAVEALSGIATERALPAAALYGRAPARRGGELAKAPAHAGRRVGLQPLLRSACGVLEFGARVVIISAGVERGAYPCRSDAASESRPPSGSRG